MKTKLITLLLIAIISVTGCSASANTTSKQSDQFTLEQLAQYNGQNGAKAYIAVDNVVYDVTNLDEWKSGAHKGFDAGQDLTQAFNNDSPHTASILKTAVKVGDLVTP